MEEQKNNAYKGNYLDNIKSNYLLKIISSYLKENKLLEIIKYNKNIKERLNIDINDYINYKKIIIEITPINISKKNYFFKYESGNFKYYHSYFNDEKKKNGEIILLILKKYQKLN